MHGEEDMAQIRKEDTPSPRSVAPLSKISAEVDYEEQDQGEMAQGHAHPRESDLGIIKASVPSPLPGGSHRHSTVVQAHFTLVPARHVDMLCRLRSPSGRDLLSFSCLLSRDC